MFKIKKIKSKFYARHMGDLPDLPISENESSLGFRRYSLALQLMKGQCHKIDMPAKANTSAVENLRRKLRDTAKAKKICAMRAELPLWRRAMYYNSWIVNMAACFLIVCISRANFSGMLQKSVSYSEDKVYSMYTHNCGDDELLLDIFSEMRSADERRNT